jgi:precorrin-6A/cobalt-precorrin-6A reductase
MTQVTVLILGGTGEARELAGRLAAAGVPGLRVVSSLAGRVSRPALPEGEVRVGGFGGVAGLAEWVAANSVAVVVDATHPFAATMSAHAVAACAAVPAPLLCLVRAPWTAGTGDTWREVGSEDAAAALLPSLGRQAFVTTGRQGLASYAGVDGVSFLIRCVDPPGGTLPADAEVLLARGPYDAAAELELMRSRGVDVLVTKNSGGALTAGKLAAARQLGIPVIMIRRPAAEEAALGCTSAQVAAQMVLRHWVLRHGRRGRPAASRTLTTGPAGPRPAGPGGGGPGGSRASWSG